MRYLLIFKKTTSKTIENLTFQMPSECRERLFRYILGCNTMLKLETMDVRAVLDLFLFSSRIKYHILFIIISFPLTGTEILSSPPPPLGRIAPPSIISASKEQDFLLCKNITPSNYDIHASKRRSK